MNKLFSALLILFAANSAMTASILSSSYDSDQQIITLQISYYYDNLPPRPELIDDKCLLINPAVCLVSLVVHNESIEDQDISVWESITYDISRVASEMRPFWLKFRSSDGSVETVWVE